MKIKKIKPTILLFEDEALIGMQQTSSINDSAQKSLIETRDRISIMFNIYKSLYQASDFQELNIRDYLDDLISNIEMTYLGYKQIKIIKDISNIIIDSKIAFPIGIIINELINNAYKYAFNLNQKGNIELTLKTINNNIKITVNDNGKGIEKKYIDQQNPDTFGYQLIHALSLQYNGYFKIFKDEGTRVEVLLKRH